MHKGKKRHKHAHVEKKEQHERTPSDEYVIYDVNQLCDNYYFALFKVN